MMELLLVICDSDILRLLGDVDVDVDDAFSSNVVCIQYRLDTEVFQGHF